MRREQHLVAFGQRRTRVTHRRGEEVDVGGLGVPLIDPVQGDPVLGRGIGGALLVLAHAEPRVVRGQDQPDDVTHAGRSQLARCRPR